MEFLTNDKLTIVGAAGMIGSNMAQTAIMMHLTPNLCLYDPYAPGLEGVAEELFHCGFEGMNITLYLRYQRSADRCQVCRIIRRCRPQGRHDPRRPC